MKVKIGISNRHIHLTEEAYRLLFEKNLTKKYDLNQPNEFAANETLTIEANGVFIENVRIVGPFRNYNQVEITYSDAKKLGINPPVVTGGNLKDAVDLVIISTKGSFKLKNCCIIPKRHVHISRKMAEALKVRDNQQVKLKVDGNKGGELTAFIKVTEDGYFEAHIDPDDAIAFGLQNKDEVDLIL